MKKFLPTVLLVLGVAVLAAVPLVGSDVVVQFGINSLLLAVLAQGWNIIGGYCGYPSFGNSSFFWNLAVTVWQSLWCGGICRLG